MPITIQTGAHQFAGEDIMKYSLMMGGLNVTHDVLKQYDPLVGGYHRLFMTRKPMAVNMYFAQDTKFNKFDAFKHILEYGNLGVNGFGSIDMDFSPITGGYAGRSFEVPTTLKDNMSSFTVKLFEFSGSPIFEIVDTWLNMVSDKQSGFAHYGGLIAAGQCEYSQANHTAEFVYVITDRTGMKVEHAVEFCNCMPKSIPGSQWDSSAGEHNITEMDLEFTCTRYEGSDIHDKAKILLKNHQIMVNSLEFYSGIKIDGTATGYDPKTGELLKRQGNTLRLADGTESSKYRVSVTQQDTSVTSEQMKDGYTYPTPSYTDYGNRIGQNRF